MKIRVVGAGPAGLCFAALMKRHDPSHDIVVVERGPRDATWGFGVVFSDRALEFMRADDAPLVALLSPHLETWPHLTIARNGVRVPIAGNGFAAIGRLQLLSLLYGHAESLGVRIDFECEVTALDQIGQADLVIAANGAFSCLREQNAQRLGTTCDWRPNRFIWYGTTQVFDSLTLSFRETPAGVFCAHHYRYSPSMSTFLVELTEATWRRAGFETMNPQDTIRACEAVFAPELGGHAMVANHSQWRQFPSIWNQHWGFDNVVLLGDALRTAHFSIGSGTRLAMEDAVALYKAFKDQGPDVAAARAQFEQQRSGPMKKIWDAANTSLRWYERMDELVPALTAVDLAYSYITRTGRVDHAKVRQLDPALAAAYEQQHPGQHPGQHPELRDPV